MEHFTFNFVEPYSCDTPFVISLGDKRYKAYLSDWSTEFNKIRLEIENSLLTYFRNTEIKLYFEDSPTIIRVRSDWEDLASITIVPNNFIDEPNIYGMCEPRQLVSALYLGLLGLCIRETDWTEDIYGWSWDVFRLATYNKLQSCVIENYIKGIGEDELTYYPRQRVINTVNEMLKDYRNLLNTLSL